MRRVRFVAMLFVGALCLFAGAALQLVNWFDHHHEVEIADARLQYAFATEPLGSMVFGDQRLYKFDLEWCDRDGSRLAVPRYVTRAQMDSLLAGGTIRLAYFPGDPRRMPRPEDHGLGTVLALFVGGLVATTVALFALRLLRREGGGSAAADWSTVEDPE